VALGPLPVQVNVATLLAAHAARDPERAAVVAADGRGAWTECTYAELEARASRIAGGLAARGLEAGDHVCVFVRPSAELIAITYALFKLGAVPILADPGMGRQRLLACMQRMAPRAFIGVPRAHAARKLFPAAFRSIELAVTVGRRLFWGGPTLARLERGHAETRPPAATCADDLAAILFTSGSTGPPKGVEYTHGMFAAQVRALQALYEFAPGEVDLCCLPLFALFDTALGMTSVFPELDPSHPGTCDPVKIAGAIRDLRCTTSFGSPAIWRRVVPWCIDNGYKLDSLKRVLVAGAPVPLDLVQAFQKVLPLDGDVFTPYGATEALPVASIAGHEITSGLADKVLYGAGTCVGALAPGIEARLMRISDAAFDAWSDELEVPLGQLGEVCVRGPVVTRRYAGDARATAAAKLDDGAGGVWHRMGDVGRFDEEGRLWFHGRKAHRLETADGLRMPVPVENVFNTHPRVHRTALVGVGARGAELPVLVVEPVPGELPRSEVMTDGFIMQLRTIGRRTPVTADIERFLFHESFPVDVRHNAKIHREELKAWAEEQLA
jgi:acyl-CoA synthetase (AMP-forming)/AMP-acid ligase II